MVAKATREGVTGPDGKLVQPVFTIHVEIGKLPMVRNRLMKMAMDSGASHVLWLDDDHVFPAWALARLTKANLDVIGINQSSRTRPHTPLAQALDSSRVYGTHEDAKQGLIEQVGSFGMNVVLMRLSVIDRLRAKAEEDGRELFPLFNFTLSSDPNVSGGEDAYFCARCSEAGIPVHVDHMLSWATWHIAELPVGMKEALEDRNKAG